MPTLAGLAANPMGLRNSVVSSSLAGVGSPADNGGGTLPGPAYTGPLAGVSFLGQPFAMYLGIIVLLFLLKFFSEAPVTPIEPRHIHIGGYNLLAVTVTSVVGIVALKLVFNRWPVPGLTQVVNFV